MSAGDDLTVLEEVWDRLGSSDPMWAVLSDNTRRGGRWDRDEFMATGQASLNRWLSLIAEMGIPVRFDKALDFGSGVGRMTQALGARFESVVGVDIAPSMVALAQETNTNPTVRFVHHNQPDLSVFPDRSFDFVFSVLVLQHIRPEFTRRYLHEFARVLAPGGILAFQLPGEPQTLPDDLFSNGIEFQGPVPARLSAGERAKVCVRVTNASPHAWALSQVFGIGNHWRRGEQILSWDDGRASLPPLGPGESATVELEVTGPAEPGDATLEVEVVAEGISWFSERGCSTASCQVLVEPAPEGTGDRIVQPHDAQMEMHFIPSSEVVRLLHSEGFDVVEARVSNRSSAWIDYWYVARRSNRPVARRPRAERLAKIAVPWLRAHLPVTVKRPIRAVLRALRRPNA